MTPSFWGLAADAYRASTAHSFVVFGDGIADYAENDSTVDVHSWLTRALVQAGFDLVVLYDPAQGITFPVPAMKRLFLQEVLEQQGGSNKGQQRGSPLAAVMSGMPQAKPEDIDLRLGLNEALPLLDKAMRLVNQTPEGQTEPYRVAVIFTMANLTFPPTPVGPLPPTLAQAYAYIQGWTRNPIWRATNAPMIWYITPALTDVAEVIRDSYAIRVPAPSYEDRYQFAEYALQANEVQLAEGMTVHRLAAMTAGLLRIHIEDVIVRARIDQVELTAEMVKARKDEIMQARFSGVLLTIEATGSLEDIAGLEYLKSYLVNEIVKPMREGETAGMPMGILMAGPPGTGKTYIAEKLAASAGVNFVIFRMANILGSYVGESERNLEKALQGIQEMTPCIVFIDEVEQSIRRDTGSSGSQVFGNIFGRLLNAMGDSRNRGTVVWLMATNRPDLLDAAFKRSGRIDAKFAVMPPDSDEERAEMFRVMARKNGVQFEDGLDLLALAAECPDYTGADIEVIVNKARKVARNAGRDIVSHDDLAHAIKVIRVQQNEQTRMMVAVALAEVNDLDNLPPRYRQRFLSGEFNGQQVDQPPSEISPSGRSGRRL